MNALDRLRLQAARIDADFAAKQFKAERELSGIRHRIALDATKAMLILPEPAPAPAMCSACLDGTHGERR